MNILGYKVLCRWGEDDWVSPLKHYPWKKGENNARCIKGDHHGGQEGCDCGLYGFHMLSNAMMGTSVYKSIPLDHIVVALSGWGDTCVYRSCFRSQKAAIIGILEGRDSLEASKKFGVPSLRWDQLKSYANENAEMRRHPQNRDRSALIEALDRCLCVAMEENINDKEVYKYWLQLEKECRLEGWDYSHLPPSEQFRAAVREITKTTGILGERQLT